MSRTLKPSCFIIMPFGKKNDMDGRQYDFDKIYQELIEPAVIDAGMDAIRADEETVNGIIHKPMYERLILCDYAIADLTTANANVFYELGVRHAVKPFTTITIFAQDSKLPFDVNFLRCLPYRFHVTDNEMNKDQAKALTEKLLKAKKEKTTDSPLYQLVDGIHFQNSVAHEKTDIFHEKVMYDEGLKNQLKHIRLSIDELPAKKNRIEAFIIEHSPLENLEAGVLVDLMLTYRSLEFYEEMVAFIEKLPAHIQQTIMVQEQKSFALNRLKTPVARAEAISLLEAVLAKQGVGSETCGILGRVYKDMFTEALAKGDALMAASYHDKALETYTNGFYADWRDAYPGVNMLMLLALKGDNEDLLQRLAPVVAFAIERKIERKKPDYWDYASLMEIAVIEKNAKAAKNYLVKMVGAAPEKWMLKTTMNNLQLLARYANQQNQNADVVEEILSLLKPYTGT